MSQFNLLIVSNYSAVVRMVCYGLVSLWNFLENHLK